LPDAQVCAKSNSSSIRQGSHCLGSDFTGLLGVSGEGEGAISGAKILNLQAIILLLFSWQVDLYMIPTYTQILRNNQIRGQATHGVNLLNW